MRCGVCFYLFVCFFRFVAFSFTFILDWIGLEYFLFDWVLPLHCSAQNRGLAVSSGAEIDSKRKVRLSCPFGKKKKEKKKEERTCWRYFRRHVS